MDKRIRSILEDLLPLYNEGLLSEETKKWFDEQIAGNEEVKNLVQKAAQPLDKLDFQSTIDQEKMFKRIHRKLAIFQIIFVAISFLLAIQSSLLNESFGFILWYSVLGLVTYLFYKDMKIVFYISFLPLFLWAVAMHLANFSNSVPGEFNIQPAEFIWNGFVGSFFMTFIHFVFALIGGLIGLLILKIKESS